MAHEMRHRISMCGTMAELQSAFSEVSGKIIGNVVGPGAAVMPLRGIMFDAASRSHFTISEALDEQQLFREAWYSSDLPAIIGRFAESAWHRYLHLKHKPGRTNLKVRI